VFCRLQPIPCLVEHPIVQVSQIGFGERISPVKVREFNAQS